LTIRPFSIKDLDDVFEYASDEETVKYLTWPTHKTKEQTIRVINQFYINNPCLYAIELNSDKKCIGAIDFRIDEQNDKASFGYVLNREYWNNGYMSETLRELMKFYFETIGVNRIEATHYMGNNASGKVMEKCNMKYEGRGIQEVKIKGVFFDVEHYAIVRDDWKY
jgi:ribosomal-protein-alanine N-acetyltransferase